MAHLVGSTAGFGTTAHKINHNKNKNTSIIFLIAQMRGVLLFAFAYYGKELSHIYLYVNPYTVYMMCLCGYSL